MKIGDTVRIIGEYLPPHLIEYGGWVGKIVEKHVGSVKIDLGGGYSLKISETYCVSQSYNYNFVDFLKTTLIPDLREDDRHMTADDLNRCVQIITLSQRVNT